MPGTYIFIYGERPLDLGLDELEGRIQDAVAPFGEVTGTGSGDAGWNLDVDLESTEPINHVLHAISRVLVDAMPHTDRDSVSLDVGGVKMPLKQVQDSLK